MPPNRLQQLHDAGQSIWLDFIDRTILHNGELERRIRDDALTGMTSNPTIFEKALAEGTAYDEQLSAAAGELSSWQLFELVETDDVRTACDLFRRTHDQAGGADGFVSIEVSPGSAHDESATLAEAKRLWTSVDRPNLMVKIPGTDEGARAVRRSVAEGMNINITLLFAIDAYRAVSDAYMSGLEDRLAKGKPIDRIHSVASFFVSRVDSEVDKRIDERLPQLSDPARSSIDRLRGKAAIANAQLAYELFQKSVASPRWKALAAKGANVQRPLWASTSAKNPAYRDVMYVEQLIGPDTVNTMPPQTIEAFRDHGEVKRTVDADYPAARRVLADLEGAGISFRSVTDKLLSDGLASFSKSFDTLIAGLEAKTRSLGRTMSARAG
ncbi:MAG: transaldolase [Gemmatimonadota bacterium]|nr:transaldolase [Gemmatimonadota bacterium]